MYRETKYQIQMLLIFYVGFFFGILKFSVARKSSDGVEIKEVEWGYNRDDYSPERWSEIFPHCGEDGQSPIDFDTDSTIFQEYDHFKFSNYDHNVPINVTMRNTGHSAALHFGDVHDMVLSGGGLPKTFRLIQMHFHWGSKSMKGSEHWVDGHQYAGEIHWVHEREEYDSITDASEFDGGLAVLGTLIKIGTISNPTFSHILDLMEKVPYADSPEVVLEDPLHLYGIISADTSKFYRYHGSLTTPPCTETVFWTVFKEPISVTEEQMQRLRSTIHHETEAEASEGTVMEENFRPPMPLNKRKVHRSWNSAAQPINVSQMSLVLTMLSVKSLSIF